MFLQSFFQTWANYSFVNILWFNISRKPEKKITLCLFACLPTRLCLRSVRRVLSVGGCSSKTCWCPRCRDSPSTLCCSTRSSNTRRVSERATKRCSLNDNISDSKRKKTFLFLQLDHRTFRRFSAPRRVAEGYWRRSTRTWGTQSTGSVSVSTSADWMPHLSSRWNQRV